MNYLRNTIGHLTVCHIIQLLRIQYVATITPQQLQVQGCRRKYENSSMYQYTVLSVISYLYISFACKTYAIQLDRINVYIVTCADTIFQKPLRRCFMLRRNKITKYYININSVTMKRIDKYTCLWYIMITVKYLYMKVSEA